MEKTAKNSKKQQKNEPNIDIWSKLSTDHWRYITARIEDPALSKGATAKYLKIPEQRVYHWPSYVDECLQLTIEDVHFAAMQQRKQTLLKAIATKMSGLDSEDESVRQKVATELIEWELGKATQKNEITGKDGGDIIISTGMDMDKL